MAIIQLPSMVFIKSRCSINVTRSNTWNHTQWTGIASGDGINPEEFMKNLLLVIFYMRKYFTKIANIKIIFY
jgi:hypothetical protein